MQRYRNQSCIHKENCNALLAYHAVKQFGNNITSISLSADNPQFEEIVITRFQQRLPSGYLALHCVEKEAEVFSKLYDHIEDYHLDIFPIHADIFDTISEWRDEFSTRKINVIQFDFCGLLTLSLFDNIMTAIRSENVDRTSIISLTTSWNHYSDKIRNEHVHLNKQYTDRQYHSPRRFRMYGLPEVIKNSLNYQAIDCQLLANFDYKATTGKSNHGTQMQFYIFKVTKS